ncbi:MAG: DNA-directed RNA polymerase subunit beta' [Armatimonadetes bacterium]|nr:DNA-directed RNA polymerase subunit beta' [Armatimonadota bacterium]
MADISRIKAIKIGLASPDDIRAWSFGEVKKPETINYRTFKPERDGLFCERIFGPTRDWECSCGRYKRVKNKGIRCERCGVEVTRARVRRERMGHIELAAPVCHLWYLKGQPPSPLGLLLDISPRQLEKVIYFTNYMVIDIDRAGIEQNLGDLQRMVEEAKRNFDAEIERVFLELDARLERELKEGADTLTEQQIAERVRMYESRKESERRERARLLEEMEKAIERLAKLQRYELLDESSWQAIEQLLITGARRLQRDLRPLVRVGQGAEAIRELLREIDLEKLDRELREEISKTQGTRRARAIKRLEIVEAFKNSKTRPEWMILDAVPVLPPELRPMVQLDGGRFATSDLNDLYRRIVNRNNRLRKIMEIRAPKSILNSEKRLLQEAVDALIDNTKRSKPVTGTGGRPLKSLSDMLKGKEGRFRKNLLGKRVDYSGRSVIVVGPTLQLHQCGLPKEMALELFKPFVMQRLIRDQLANNVKNAKNAIDRQLPEVWKALESVIREHPVLLNRAPTLHRLGIQAFEPVLVEGKAIQLHPLVCHAYNADFDGDQMAVHVPLSFPAQAEARTLMLSTHNLFKPADGSPVVSPLQDIVLGAYYLTMSDPQRQQEVRYRFANPEEARLAFERGDARLHEPIEVRLVRPNAQDPEFVQTTIGRLMFHEIMPDELRYHPDWLNVVYNKKMLSAVIRAVYQTCGHARTVRFLDDLKALGFEWGLRGGITFALTDMAIPAQRDAILQKAAEEARRIDELYDRGELTQDEKRQRKIQLWQRVYDEVSKVMLQELRDDNPLFIITDSGARGSTKQLAQLVGMRGLMMGGFDFRSGGERLVEELPVQHNFQEGLTTLEYFVSGYGARRGLASTALLTANAGYLTRRMCDVAQDVVIREHDCGTPEGIVVSRIEREGDLIETLFQRIRGRTARRDLRHPITGEPLVAENEIIPEAVATELDALAQATERFTQTLRELSGKDEFELFTPTDDEPLRDPITGETLLEPYDMLTQEVMDRLHARRDEIRTMWLQAGYEWVEHDRVGVPIRSPLTCNTRQGVCAKCYGLDMGTLRPVELGTAVGIIAAESIGEPGTQLTMRVFHASGVAGSGQVIASFKMKAVERSFEPVDAKVDQLKGRVPERTLFDPHTKKVLATAGRAIDERSAKEIEELARRVAEFVRMCRKVESCELGKAFREDVRHPFTGKQILLPSDEDLLLIEQRLHSAINELRVSFTASGFSWNTPQIYRDKIKDDQKTREFVPFISDVREIIAQGVGSVYEKDKELVSPIGDKKVLLRKGDKIDIKKLKELHNLRQKVIAHLQREKCSIVEYPVAVRSESKKDEEEAQTLDLSKDQKHVLLKVAANQLGKPVPVLATDEPSDGEDKIEKRTRDSLRRLNKLQEPPNSGINRVEELFEARKPKGEAITVDYAGEVVDVVRSVGRWVVIKATLPVGDLLVGKMSLQTIEDARGNPIVSEMDEIRAAHLTRLHEAGVQEVTVLDAVLVPPQGSLEVVKGDTVLAGDRLTPGPLNPHELLRLRGVRGVQEYLIREIQAVYKAQGVDIDDKHLEVIIRQMLRKRRVIDPGDAYFLPGQTVDRFVFEDANRKVIAEGGRPATAEWVLLGVSEAAQQTESFLSAASFQRTVKALTEAAVRGKVDELVGLKENVIIGRLIPAGTGYVKPRFEPKFEWGARADEAAAVVETREPTLGTLFEEELAADDGEAQATDGGAPNTESTLRLADSSPDAPALELTLRPAAGEADAPDPTDGDAPALEITLRPAAGEADAPDPTDGDRASPKTKRERKQ